ncbi:unnamed protein product [Allacma fusca]|uniref:Glucose dehydrogenase [FAD, quinone] n=1 Tax=Allacma fusca TaxID=39272 RepID=A0A8J2KRG6_9HEXA|nr:unnamed protein product [Allacma fusca]
MIPPITALYTLRTQYLFLLFLGVPVPSLFNSYYKSEQKFTVPLEERTGNIKDDFDFIVVGGGTAGLAVANRLSKEYKTLLLEAGGHPFPLTAVPPLAPPMLNNPDIDWMDKAVPQKHACQGIRNNGTLLNRGKGLGGSSMLNFMMVMRGNPNDYNLWANETNDPEWSYENLLPFFKKMEDYHGQYRKGSVHGKGGPLYITRPDVQPLHRQWRQAAEELGYVMKDPNGYQTESFFRVDSNILKGSRHSTYSAYLEKILNRNSLTVRLYSQVTKVEFDKNNKAVGVRYVQGGREYLVKCRKEVILSADHVFTQIGPFLVEEELSILINRDFNPVNFRRYLVSGKGPLSILGAGGGAVLSSSQTTPDWPDILFVLQAVGLHTTAAPDLTGAFDFKPGVLENYFANHLGRDAFTVAIAGTRPKSRGQVKLASKDPFQPLIVDPNYFDHPDDLKVVMEGVKVARKLILETKAFRDVGVRLVSNLFPGCEKHKDNTSDEYWECFVKHFTTTMWHWTSTCRMGSGPQDKNSVVDSKLRVHGTTGLRVIDASVMPHVTNANINIPCILIGEKGADIILNHWAGVCQ